MDHKNHQHKEKGFFAQYWPLISVFIISLVLSVNTDFKFNMKLFMGYFLLFLGFLKLIDLKGFAQSFTNYDPITRHFNFYGYLYPFIELFLAVMLLKGIENILVYALGAVILGLTGLGIFWQRVIKKQNFACACMGSKVDLPLGAVSFFENFVMVLMFIALIFNL